ncbi:MAG: cytochrome C oxidase subunit IV family protein [Anaerolineae bacterium]
MADEQKKPEEETLTDDMQDKAEDIVDTVEDALDDAQETVEDVAEDAQETVEDVAEDAQETVEDVTKNVQDTATDMKESFESGARATSSAIVHADGDHDGQHHYTDEVVLPYFGSIGTMPGGIYTFVFLVLGALTLIEVLITIIFPENAITIGLLVLLSLGKAYLVVMYYMHLNRDNPIFRVVLLLPLLVVLLSTLYLLGVPTGAGLGYN